MMAARMPRHTDRAALAMSVVSMTDIQRQPRMRARMPIASITDPGVRYAVIPATMKAIDRVKISSMM